MYFIREATPEDVETIRNIAETTWWATYGPILEKEQIIFMLDEIYSTRKLASQLTHCTQTYLLLIEENKPVAFAAYSPREEDPEIYKLHKLYCMPETQGKGYGKILINKVIDKTLEAGKRTLDLNVNRYNKAKNFYEKMGFEKFDEHIFILGQDLQHDWKMKRRL